jgi:hypothetical protein
MVLFGGVLYMVGGLTNDPTKGWEWSNAMWGVDLATYFSNAGATPAPTMTWNKIQSINAPGMFSPRGAFSLDVYSATIYMFGGLTRTANLAPGPPGQIVCTRADAQCQVFNDLWMWQPGSLAAPLSTTTCSPDQSANCGWKQVAVGGSVLPPSRYGHASGVSSDHLYVFGGFNAAGAAFTDLWAFNTDANVWFQVNGALKNFNAFPPQKWEPALAVVGHNLYVSMTGDEGGHAIYRYVPPVWTPGGGGPFSPAGGGGGGGNAAAASAAHVGTTAGIVILSLLAIANLYVLVLVAKNGGVELLPFGSGRRQAYASTSSAGFYAGVQGAPSEYVAPAAVANA